MDEVLVCFVNCLISSVAGKGPEIVEWAAREMQQLHKYLKLHSDRGVIVLDSIDTARIAYLDMGFLYTNSQPSDPELRRMAKCVNINQS